MRLFLFQPKTCWHLVSLKKKKKNSIPPLENLRFIPISKCLHLKSVLLTYFRVLKKAEKMRDFSIKKSMSFFPSIHSLRTCRIYVVFGVLTNLSRTEFQVAELLSLMSFSREVLGTTGLHKLLWHSCCSLCRSGLPKPSSAHKERATGIR